MFFQGLKLGKQKAESRRSEVRGRKSEVGERTAFPTLAFLESRHENFAPG